MKRTHRCPKCNHGCILHIVTIADHFGRPNETGHVSVPMKVARYVRPQQTLLGTAVVEVERAGELEAGVCPQCGYTEFYTRDPSQIVVDGTNVREFVAEDGEPTSK